MDGLWSGEKIIVFTTNHKEKELDPALLSPGRMGFHINLSYLKSKPFQILAKNYLGIEHHPTFEEIQCLLEVLEVTPAEVAELLLQFQFEDAESSLECLLNFLKKQQRRSAAVLEQQRRSEGTSL